MKQYRQRGDFILFNNKKDYEHKLYGEIRDCIQRSATKTQMMLLWDTYSKYAPKNFKNHLQREIYFKQRWWEMYLGVGLINMDLKIKTSIVDKCPDYRVNINNKIVNIEAIAPKMGDPKSDDKLCEMKMGVHDLNDDKDKFLLRLSSALKEKKDKFNKYVEENTIDKNDINIIALSGCALSQYGSLMDFPVSAPATILYDVNNLSINLTTEEIGYTLKSGITKSNGNLVPTVIFNSKDYQNISAVIYSNSDVLNSSEKPESTFVMMVNPNAINKIDEMTMNQFCCKKIY